MTLSTATPAAESSTAVLMEAAAARLEEHLAACRRAGTAVMLDDRQRAGWHRLLATSRYVDRVLSRQPTLLAEPLWTPLSRKMLEKALRERLNGIDNESALQHALRCFRHTYQLHLLWAQINEGTSAWTVAAGATWLAEVVLSQTLAWLEARFVERWGSPCASNGSVPRLVVLGMGKLGAGELNLSSDIDLILAYADEGETTGGRRSLSHQEFFTRLGQALIRVLDAVTIDGQVFRVDMRLRPFGDSGPLVGSFASLERYYQQHGREWERYALLKARAVAGDMEAGKALLTTLRPFVYRRYIDFGVIDALRDMKHRIQREVRRQGREQDIKLGEGGIREVEFIVQAGQLIHGGRHAALQTPSLKQAMTALGNEGLLPVGNVCVLEQDYLRLRALEHALQAVDDAQTQRLPDDDNTRQRVVMMLGLTHWTALADTLATVRERVHATFMALIDPPDEGEEARRTTHAGWQALWEGSLTKEEGITLLSDAGFVESERMWQHVRALADGRAVGQMQAVGRDRLDRLMPILLDEISTPPPCERDGPRYGYASRQDSVLVRVIALIEAVLRRTAYLALLWENTAARRHLVQLCAASPRVAEQLARHPALLDELLDPVLLDIGVTAEGLSADLDQTLNRLPLDDDEAQLEALRQFRHAQTLRIAASDLFGLRTLMQVSDALTEVAEVLLQRVLRMALRALSSRHGQPLSAEGQPAGFIIVGYGKLGSIELGYDSDLDLVFLHDADAHGTTQGGMRPLDNTVFMTRLGQRVIHLLTALTPSGALYEVDMRLRPSGNAGLLVSSFDAFKEYQCQKAWLWEQQALVRARVVAGSSPLGKQFEALRRALLGRKRPVDEVRNGIIAMRQRMLAQHETQGNVKQMKGGVIDIEFMVQYAVLAYGHDHAELLQWTDNVRLLETMARCGVLPAADAAALYRILLDYRRGVHGMALLMADDMASLLPDLDHNRITVRRIWHALLEIPCTAR